MARWLLVDFEDCMVFR